MIHQSLSQHCDPFIYFKIMPPSEWVYSTENQWAVLRAHLLSLLSLLSFQAFAKGNPAMLREPMCLSSTCDVCLSHSGSTKPWVTDRQTQKTQRHDRSSPSLPSLFFPLLCFWFVYAWGDFPDLADLSPLGPDKGSGWSDEVPVWLDWIYCWFSARCERREGMSGHKTLVLSKETNPTPT